MTGLTVGNDNGVDAIAVCHVGRVTCRVKGLLIIVLATRLDEEQEGEEEDDGDQCDDSGSEVHIELFVLMLFENRNKYKNLTFISLYTMLLSVGYDLLNPENVIPFAHFYFLFGHNQFKAMTGGEIHDEGDVAIF